MSRGHRATNRTFTRRAFIAGSAGVAGVVAVGESRATAPGKALQQLESTELERLRLDAASGTTPAYALIMRRAEDQVLLTFGFWNIEPVFDPVGTAPATFDVIDDSKPTYMTVEFGLNYQFIDPTNSDPYAYSSHAPQNLLENAFPIVGKLDKKQHINKKPTSKTFQPSQVLKDPHNPTEPSSHSLRPTGSTDPKLSQLPVKGLMAGQTWLAFAIPANMLGGSASTPLLMTADSLLSWTGLELSTVPVALPPLGAFSQIPAGLDRNDLRTPKPTETNIEMPYGLILSPPARLIPPNEVAEFVPTTVFIAQTQPVQSQPPNSTKQFTELWHARMGARYQIFFTGGFETVNQAAVKRAKAQQRANPKPHDIIGIYETVIDDHTRELMTARAVWCTDLNFKKDVDANKNEPGPAIFDASNDISVPSLRYPDRYDIVRLTSDFTPTNASSGPTGGPRGRATENLPAFMPSPISVDRLILSSLGGWLNSDGHWDLGYQTKVKDHASYNSSLLSWRHRAAQGRDSYVRVVRKGYLFPWGHVASLITITEREVNDVGGVPGAFLRQKTFIVVSNPVKTYNDGHAPDQGRALPFTSVEALTLITPPIEVPTAWTSVAENVSNPELCFEPMIGSNTPFKFHMRGTDWAGAPVDFHTPVLWVDFTTAFGDTQDHHNKIISGAISKWNTSSGGTRPTISLHSQRVSVAPPVDVTDPGPTQFAVSSFQVSAAEPAKGTSVQTLINASLPHFYPTMHRMTVGHPELSKATGKAIQSTNFEYYSTYLSAGFVPGVHKGSIFLVVPNIDDNGSNPGTTMAFSSDHSGGSITPSLNIIGYSRAIGPVSGHPNKAANKGMAHQVADINAGNFKPSAIFAASGASEAKLLGGIPLSDILQEVQFAEGDDNSSTLTITTNEIRNPHHIRTVIDWHPTIQPDSQNIFQPLDDDGSPTDASSDSMDLHAVIITALDNSIQSSTSVICQIRNFNLNLFGDGSSEFITIPVDSLSFRAVSGKKTDVQVQVNTDGVTFDGPLGFVQDLSSYLAFDGSGITINTSGSGIEAGLTLAIPNITLGVLALDNIAFTAAVNIPYNGDPVDFTFDFCSQENPFQLEVLIFTGGGYVHLEIGPQGVIGLGIGFDFGFGYSLNLGIASGQVGLTGNISYTSTGVGKNQDVTLSAGITAGGGVSCLGCISVSVSLDLILEWDITSGSLTGSADLEVSVHIIFFGFSIGIGFSETFGGSTSGDFRRANAHALAASPDVSTPPNSDPVGPATPPSATKPNTFGGNMLQSDWTQYCSSFVPIAA